MRQFTALVLLAVLLSGCVPCTPCPPCVTPTPVATATATVAPTATPGVWNWDPRLDAYNVKVERVAGARFRLTKVWLTVDGNWDAVPAWAWEYVAIVTGGGGATNMFAGVYKLDGSPQEGKSVIFGWPGTQTSFTTDAAGWGNGYCQAVYYPDKGQTGPYYLEPLKGDKLIGGGLPYGNHVSIFGVWEELPPATILERVRRLFEP